MRANNAVPSKVSLVVYECLVLCFKGLLYLSRAPFFFIFSITLQFLDL